jgi:hypothetical protein
MSSYVVEDVARILAAGIGSLFWQRVLYSEGETMGWDGSSRLSTDAHLDHLLRGYVTYRVRKESVTSAFRFENRS